MNPEKPLSVMLNPESPLAQYPRNPLPPPGRLRGDGGVAGERLVEAGHRVPDAGAVADLADRVLVVGTRRHVGAGERDRLGGLGALQVQTATLGQDTQQITGGHHENPHRPRDPVIAANGARGRDPDTVGERGEGGGVVAHAATRVIFREHKLTSHGERTDVIGSHHQGDEGSQDR